MDKRIGILLAVVISILIGTVLYYTTPVMEEGSYRGLLRVECGGVEKTIEFNFSIGSNSTRLEFIKELDLCNAIIVFNVTAPRVTSIGLNKQFNITISLNKSAQSELKDIRYKLELYSPGNYKFIYIPTYISQARDYAVFTIKTLYRTKEAAFVFGSAVVLFVASSIIPYVITSIYLTIALFLFGALSLSEPFTLYMSDTCLVFLAGSALEIVIKNTGLAERIAWTLRGVAKTPSRIFLGTILIGGFMSMWMSNTSATYLLLPIVVAIAAKTGIEDSRLFELVLIGIAVGTTIGGSATIVGTPPNLIVSGYLNTNIYSKPAVTFQNWLYWGLPYFAIATLVAYAVFLLMYKYMGRGEIEYVKEKLAGITETMEERRKLNRSEILGASGILFLVIMWLTESIHGVKTGVAGMIGLLIFLVLGVLSPRDIKDLCWDIVILMGGGLTLGRGLIDTGFSDIIAQVFIPYTKTPTIMIWLIGFASLMIGTFFSSHTAAVAFLTPIVAPVGYMMGPLIGLSPAAGAAYISIVSTLALDTSVALPISTPPSAIIFGTGKVRVRTLFIYGMVFGIITLLITLIVMPHLIPIAIPR